MSWERIISRELRELEARLVPPVTELGTVVFVAAGLFAVIAAAAEFLQPGFVVNYISPRVMVGAVVLSGGLALLGRPRPVRRNRRQHLVYAGGGLLATVLSFWAAWYYFQSVSEMRIALVLAVSSTVAAAFWLSGRAADNP